MYGTISLLLSGVRMVAFGKSYETAQLSASVKMLLSLLNSPHVMQKATCEGKYEQHWDYLELVTKCKKQVLFILR
jgi:hypothetical protein